MEVCRAAAETIYNLKKQTVMPGRVFRLLFAYIAAAIHQNSIICGVSIKSFPLFTCLGRKDSEKEEKKMREYSKGMLRLV